MAAPSLWLRRRRPCHFNGITLSTAAAAAALSLAALLLCIVTPTRSTAWTFAPARRGSRFRTADSPYSILTLHAGREGLPRRLRTDADVSIGKLAGAIKKRAKTYGHAEVSGMGPKVIFRLLKSIDLASKFIQEDDGSGRAMAASVRKETTARGNVLHTFIVQEVEAAPEISESDLIRVGSWSWDDEEAGDEKKNLMDKLEQSLEEDGQVALTGLGPGAAINIIKALETASSSDMGESSAAAEDTLTVLPWWENVQTYRGEKRRLVAYCQRRPGFMDFTP